MLDEELQHLDGRLVFIRRVEVGWVREYTRLEDDGEVAGWHEVLVGSSSKDGQKIEYVEEEVLIGRGRRYDEQPVGLDGRTGIEGLLDDDVAELIVEVKRDDGLWHLVEVAPQYARRIVDAVPRPVYVLAVPRWQIKRLL